MYQIYSGKAYAVSLRLTVNTKLAEDITVKAFLSAWENISFLRHDMAFAGWLTGIVIYNFIQDVLLKEEPPEQNFNVTFPATYQRNRIEDSILRLPGKERYLAVLHFIEKYSLEETADFLGIAGEEVQDLYSAVIQNLLESMDYTYDTEQLLGRMESIPFKIDPAPGVWERIVSQLRTEKIQIQEKIDKTKQEIEETREKEEQQPAKKEKKKKEKSVKIRIPLKVDPYALKKYGMAAAGAAGIIFIIYWFLFAGKVSWDVTNLKGSVRINNVTITGEPSLGNEETITANSNSGFTINVSTIGRITASSNTSVKRKSDSSFQIIKGNIKVLEENNSAVLVAELPSGKVTSLHPGGEYEIQVIPGNNAVIKNKTGWTKLVTERSEFYLLPGYNCTADEILGAGIPYHKESSEEVKQLLKEFMSSPDSRDDIVDRLIITTRNKDLVSLWNILKLASPMKRGDIYDYFEKLIFMPADITKEGIIYLDYEMMMDLLAELEPALII